MISDSVQPAAANREPFIAPPRYCAVCEQELGAGYGRHPTCDPRWLNPKPASGATTSGNGSNE